MEKFSCKTTILSGPGSLAQLKELGIRRLFLVTDPFFQKEGTAQRLLTLSGAAETMVFDQVKPDPSAELVARGTGLLRKFAPDTLVALGGGSALDCGKAMAYFSKLPLRLVAIPTTSGSGSEVTDFAILTHQGVKHPLVDSRLQPDVAIVDSDLLEKLPGSLVADTGFDVLAHAAEAYVAKNASPLTDALARDAFSTAYRLLPASFAGDQRAREAIHTAATMAGLAFNQAGLGLCHAISHALGGTFHVPHGRLNALLLPGVLECNANLVRDRYAALARGAGLAGSGDMMAFRNLKNGLLRLRRELGLPQNLRQAGVDPRDLRSRMQSIVEAALADPCCRTNPVGVEDFMIRRILEEAAGNG